MANTIYISKQERLIFDQSFYKYSRMKKKLKSILLACLFLAGLNSTFGQKKIEVGITTGAIRFYPEASFINQDYNNSMNNGFGWSAGIFLEKPWKPKIHPIIELNFYNFLSDVYLHEINFLDPTDSRKQEYIIQDLVNEPFNYLSFSLGIKYYLGKRLFICPGFEIARSCKKQVQFNELRSYFGGWTITNPFILKEENTRRIISNAKLGIGINLKKVDLILEYSHGFDWQLSVYDYDTPLGFAQRNSYLQLKVQVPLLKANRKL